MLGVAYSANLYHARVLGPWGGTAETVMEGVRWLEWGMRSYENFALGLAVLLFAIAVLRTICVLRRSGS